MGWGKQEYDCLTGIHSQLIKLNKNLELITEELRKTRKGET